MSVSSSSVDEVGLGKGRWDESKGRERGMVTSDDFPGGELALTFACAFSLPPRPVRLSFRLTRELEKKFSDRHVVFLAQRRMLRQPTRHSRVKQQRPRSRTLTVIHEKILEDLVFPSEITVSTQSHLAVCTCCDQLY